VKTESLPANPTVRPPSPIPWAALFLTGAVGGILSGLFAIGGAIAMVPLLVWRAGMDQRRAAATSLVAVIPTAVASSATYLAHGAVDVVAALLISSGAIGGAVIGSRLLQRLPMAWLRWAFIGFILAVAAHLVIDTHESARAMAFSPVVAAGYVVLGIVTGVASGLFGIGGAIIAVPVLGSVFGFTDVIAKGTALLVSIPTSLAGTVGNRRGDSSVDVRAGLILGVTAAVTAVPAALLAVALPPEVSGLMFAALLVAIAVHLSIKARRAG
jgi:uncharacterized membrane protein YfcA